MNMKRISSGLAAATLLAAGSLALAPTAGTAGATETTAPTTCAAPTEHWPASAEGRPTAHPESVGVYLWHTATGWRVRVNDPGADRAVFTGSVRVDGEVFAVGRHLENGAEGVVKVGPKTAAFRFVNYGGVDGINFGTKCSTSIRVAVRKNGVAVSAEHVYIGSAGNHPASVPVTITRTA